MRKPRRMLSVRTVFFRPIRRGGAYSAPITRGAAYSTEGGTQERTLTARVGCNQLRDMLMLSIEFSRVGAWSNRSVRHTLVHVVYGM